MRQQSRQEETFNAFSHGFGFLLSILGFVLLLIFQKYKSFSGLLGIILYGSSLCTLYLASTFYHYSKDSKRKNIFRILDHISIYILIAGTYSPVVLIALKESSGWTLFWIVWGIAIIGSILKIFFTGKYETVSLILYLLMGWLIVFDFNALKQAVDPTGILFLIAGGVFYMVGVVFYALDKFKYSHAIWHIFVLLGSISHYLFIFLSII